MCFALSSKIQQPKCTDKEQTKSLGKQYLKSFLCDLDKYG